MESAPESGSEGGAGGGRLRGEVVKQLFKAVILPLVHCRCGAIGSFPCRNKSFWSSKHPFLNYAITITTLWHILEQLRQYVSSTVH